MEVPPGKMVLKCLSQFYFMLTFMNPLPQLFSASCKGGGTLVGPALAFGTGVTSCPERPDVTPGDHGSTDFKKLNSLNSTSAPQ